MKKILSKLLFATIALLLSSACMLLSEENSPLIKRHQFKKWKELDIDTVEYISESRCGLKLPPDQYFEFLIPQKFKTRKINYVYIEHRKNPLYFDPDQNGMDKSNPWIRVKAHDLKNDQWKTWKDQFGSDKRSANRLPTKPKKNTLYNFPQFVGDFLVDALRVENHATGNKNLAASYIHKVGISFLGEGNRVPKENIKLFKRYKQLNSMAIRYTLDSSKGLELEQNHSFDFLIPKKFQNKHLLYAVLKHRKDPSRAVNPEDPEAFDPNAAYILCELKNKATGLWHKWVDRSSKAKFSEIRPKTNPEDETLHNGLRTFGMIYGEKFRLTNIGKGEFSKTTANIHELELVFIPDYKNPQFLEKIFTPETAFNDIEKGLLVPLFGGGARLGGQFPGAILLGARTMLRKEKLSQLPEKAKFTLTNDPGEGASLDSMGRLHIDLPPKMHFVQFEAALGDLDITSMEFNKDGYFGRSGKAEATVFLRNKFSPERNFVLISRNNIGMAGLLATGAPNCNFETIDGDEIVLQIDFDAAFLMGYRICLEKTGISKN